MRLLLNIFLNILFSVRRQNKKKIIKDIRIGREEIKLIFRQRNIENLDK